VPCLPHQREARRWRAYGRDDAVNGRPGHGGVGFVLDERFVGDGLDDTINTVDRLLPGLTIEHFTRQTAGSVERQRLGDAFELDRS
jgi:hypothetical protein